MDHNFYYKTDESAFDFVKEILHGDNTYAVNFDRLFLHSEGYVIIEFLLCDARQPHVTPYTSHPRNYWNRNHQKFLSLYRYSKLLDTRLLLVNYAKAGTPHQDEVLMIEVLDMQQEGITREKCTKFTRSQFAEWFQQFNNQCL
ncbi:MAG: hypothetical protein MJZ61_01480 [Bacteroidales bacterium]|nr:hypothetical protein [Bacteroidales bacterium]